MPPPLPGLAVAVGPRRRKRPLPHPFAPGIGIFPGERGGELDPTGSLLKVTLVLCPDGLEMAGEIGLQHLVAGGDP
jgi:hypothetical protein